MHNSKGGWGPVLFFWYFYLACKIQKVAAYGHTDLIQSKAGQCACKVPLANYSLMFICLGGCGGPLNFICYFQPHWQIFCLQSPSYKNFLKAHLLLYPCGQTGALFLYMVSESIYQLQKEMYSNFCIFLMLHLWRNKRDCLLCLYNLQKMSRRLMLMLPHNFSCYMLSAIHIVS